MEVNQDGYYPCPFCGEAHNLAYWTDRNELYEVVDSATDSEYVLEDYEEQIDQNVSGGTIKCRGCYSRGAWGSTREEAREKWNNRGATLKTIAYRVTGEESVMELQLEDGR